MSRTTFRNKREVNFSTNKLYVDGIELTGQYTRLEEFSIHQPKKPPIPEDAVVIADYMLMADFVAQSSAGIDKISKGTRSVSCSRDFFIDDTGSNTVTLDHSVIHQTAYHLIPIT